jgi:putative transposase
MARKRHSDEDILKLLREIEVRLASGRDVSTARRAAGIGDATYYAWRKKFGGIGQPQLSELNARQPSS